MIFQLFPMVREPYTMRYSSNMRGALEIIPKPSGMGIYTRPTALSTHAPDDDYLNNTRYDNSGIRVMRNDEGYECVYISHSLHGRYLQIGVQDRDRYTRYRDGYKNPSQRTPPINWSMRFRGRLQTPIELIPQEWERNGFVGTESGTEDGDAVYVSDEMREIERAPWKIQYALADFDDDYVPVNGTRREAGDLAIDEKKKVGMCIIGAPSVLCSGFRVDIGDDANIADMVPDSMNYDPKTIFPGSAVQKNVFQKFPYYLLQFGKSYVPSPGTDEKWGMWKTDGYTPVKGKPDKDTGLIPIHATNPVYGGGVKIDTTAWEGSTKSMVVGTRECFFDWPVCTYEVDESHRTEAAGQGKPHHKRATYVPMMAMFFPVIGQKGPIDHVTGRRLCLGASILIFLTTDSVRKYYDKDTSDITLTMYQLQHPITKIFGYDSAFDLGKELGGPSEDAVMPRDEAVVQEAEQARMENAIQMEEKLWRMREEQKEERGTQMEEALVQGENRETQTEVPAPIGMGKLLSKSDEKLGEKAFPNMWSRFTYYEKFWLVKQLKIDEGHPDLSGYPLWYETWYLEKYSTYKDENGKTKYATPLEMLVDEEYREYHRRT